MKHFIFTFGLLVVTSIYSDFCIAYGNTMTLQQFDKTTMIQKKIKSAQKSISEGDFNSAQNTIKSILKLDPNNSIANELQTECEKGIAAQKERIKKAYNNACLEGTATAYKAFVAKYPNSEYIHDVNQRIEDYDMWLFAKNNNTIESYQYYLNNSSRLAYKTEAEEAIYEIKVTQDWIKCKDSNDESLLSAFISNHPKSSNINDAKYRLNILNGERYYNQGNVNLAYSCLKDANDYISLSGKHAEMLKQLNEFKEYDEIAGSSDKDEVKTYLNKISSNSPYYIKASNQYAILLAKALSSYSSEYSYNEALSYTKDESTKNIVKSYIDNVKKQKAYDEHQRKVAAHKRWWKENFKIGIEGDVEMNIDEKSQYSYSGDDATAALLLYSAGVSFRFGSYRYPFSLTTGVKYRWISYNPNIGDSSIKQKWDQLGGAICVPLNLRLNVCKLSSQSRLFIGGGGEYAFSISPSDKFKDIFEDNYMSLYPMLGAITPNFEISVYWKSYLRCPFNNYLSDDDMFKCNNMVGVQMGIYF